MNVRKTRRPNAQPFDEIVIKTVPIFKKTKSSGDEWRIEAEIQIKRKGVVHHTSSYPTISDAVQCLSYEWIRATNRSGYYASEYKFCDQEGCDNRAHVTYKLKQQYCNKGHKIDPYTDDKRPIVRQFCKTHQKRGNRSFDDCDTNYEPIKKKSKVKKSK